MQPNWQIPRTGLLWMLISVAMAIFLHFKHLPIWLIVAAIVSIVWQVQAYRGAWRRPGKLLKVVLTLFCFGGVLASYGMLLGLEPMVALLISGFVLKLLEINYRRDALVFIFLAYLVVVIQLLFEQYIVDALQVLLGILMVTAALVGLHQSSGKGHWFRPFRKSVVLICQSIPLMAVLFIVMPRIGALWSVPQESHGGVLGVGDSMSPGDFTDLSASRKVAFRVEFDGDIPTQSSLYWRGLVFSEFDGRRWTPLGPWGYKDGSLVQWYGDEPERWDDQAQRHGDPLSYQVTLEATNSSWLFALATPKPESGGVGLTRDFRLYSKYPATSQLRYQASSWLDYQLEVEGLTSWRRQLELTLPEGYNPETLERAKAWRAEADDELALINRLLQFYNREFTYTLRPPLLGKHTADEFLWQTKRGFCEFFASSFVIFMRAAGIPARVVAGYQGGEQHPDEGYLIVHQYDAHAWAEVWLEGQGWIRIDPTAAVAPERIEYSFADMFGQDDSFLEGSFLALERYRHINWVNQLRLRLDALDYAWSKWVLGYENVQVGLLTGFLGVMDPVRIGLLFLIAASLALLPVVVMLYLGREKDTHDDLDLAYLWFCQRMESAGIKRQTGEGPRHYAQRVAELRPELSREVNLLTALYEEQRYQARKPRVDVFRSGLRRFRRSFVTIPWPDRRA
jgi:transglutaminase-like putative cysteine protease